MQTTYRFSQARSNPERVAGLRERLSRGAQLGGEILAFASLALALATTLVALAILTGQA